MEEYNPQIDIEKLPDVRELVFVGLERDYLKVLVIKRVIFSLVQLAVVVTLFVTQPVEIHYYYYIALIVLAVMYIGWRFLVTFKGFQHKAFALRDKDIVYKSGWLWRYMITTPFNRVQHVQIDQGPFERKFNLSKLKVFTAGGGSGDLVVPGIRPETANELKEFIVRKTEDGEEE